MIYHKRKIAVEGDQVLTVDILEIFTPNIDNSIPSSAIMGGVGSGSGSGSSET